MNWLGSRSNFDLVEDAPRPKETHQVFVNLQPPAPPAALSPNQAKAVREPNKIRTSKYTILSFLPKNLFEQFRSIANFYFLSLVILQAFPPFDDVSILLTAAPIFIIVTLTAFKDAIEDYRRHQADKSVNSSKTYLLSGWVNVNFEGLKSKPKKKRLFPSRRPTNSDAPQHEFLDFQDGQYQSWDNLSPNRPLWKLSNWEDVRVGDFVCLRNNDRIPADIVIIASSEPDCMCYVETKNLDGETNLKVRRGGKQFPNVRSAEDCAGLRLRIDSEMPNSNMFSYTGVLDVYNHNHAAAAESIPLGINNILLRGCVLRNTDWCIGISVYTGQNTKVLLNSGATPSKRSRIDRQMNPLVLVNFLLLGGICVICTTLSALYTGTFIYESPPFVPAPGSANFTTLYTAFFTFFHCMIIFQSIIPIALYISVDVSKTIQAYMISLDEDFYDPETNKYLQPRAWNLCDDLGQIEYIFSDKTGTLTCNVMDFRKCSINGVMYGESSFSEGSSDLRERAARRQEEEEQMRSALTALYPNPYLSRSLAFVDKEIVWHLSQNGDQARKIREFFSLLAVCHTVLVSLPNKDNPFELTYNAQSPDEAALVAVARDMGFTFLRRLDSFVEVDIIGQTRRYEILNVLEFSSDRKRMSVVMRRPEGQIVILVKGADSIIFERLKQNTALDNMDELTELTAKHLEIFANDGLRTLCLAYKVITEAEYDAWVSEYKQAQTSLENREQKVDAVANKLEQNLTLMGATAIEDKLQDGVPESIKTLAQAGVKLWVLTGDKMETAINIGFACNLLSRDMYLIIIKSTSYRNTYEQLVEALEKFWKEDGLAPPGASHAMIIDGPSLKFALGKTCKPLLLELGCRCKAVICCRVSPLQKAKVVSLVRRGLGALCLAIGDGANDVSMIQEADIGIGISGKEGLQAVMASDYAISQFRFLSKLLLVHGRWGSIRAAGMVLNYFYKNAVWLFVIFWYQFDCSFSSDLITDFSYGLFFNTLFTLLPTIIIGIFDQDVNQDVALQVPQLYFQGVAQNVFTPEGFWIQMAEAVWHSLVAYHTAKIALGETITSPQGRSDDKDATGTLLAISVIVTVNLYNGINTSFWCWITFMGILLSLIIWFAYLIVFVRSADSTSYGQLDVTMQEPAFYLTIPVILSFVFLPRFVCRYISQTYFPTDLEIVREVQKFFWTPSTVLRTELAVKDDHDVDGRTSAQENFNAGHDGQAGGSQPPHHERPSLLGAPMVSPPDKYVERQNFTDAESPVTGNPDGFVPPTDWLRRRSSDVLRRRAASESQPPTGVMDDAASEHVRGQQHSKFGTRATAFLRKVPESLGIRTRPGRNSASLLFMGTHEQLPNTGFCFSHEGGMTDVVTPTSPSFQ
ncbi:hypothetical protein DFJ73DRAFT_809180 [Zopfochytrium polystomum]|nr:hypothetical protein DFJ73DRAFT_809180 [Zopfochytrium polystomum]